MNGKPLLIVYKEAPDYRVHHADGVFGGLTGNGTLALTFYSEATAKLHEERVVVSAQGKLTESQSKPELGADVLRTYHAQFLMPPSVAAALHAFLGHHLAELRRARGGEDML